MLNLTAHNCRSRILQHSLYVWYWLSKDVKPMTPFDLLLLSLHYLLCHFFFFFLFLTPVHLSVPAALTPSQLEVAALGCRPRSRLPWLEALMLLLFQALWCHLKEGPALIPGAVSQSQGEGGREGGREEGREDERRFSEEEVQSIKNNNGGKMFARHVVTGEMATVYMQWKTATHVTTSNHTLVSLGWN